MFIRGRDSRTRFPFLVAIETDPERTSAPGGRPQTLDQGDAEQMLAHLTADLGSVLGGIGKCHLASCGMLFDQCQILRPGLPVFEALEGLLKPDQHDAITPGQTAIGSSNGDFSESALVPDKSIPPGVLLLLPIVIAGPSDLVKELAEEMEHRFLGEGQVSAHTASWLEAAFHIGISHARFMTVTDLNAMFRIQLEHFGYLPLWDLTDAAVMESEETLSLQAANGMQLGWQEGAVHIVFETFDFWANKGGGHDLPGDSLDDGYANWIRELRRYTSTLAAHHVPMRFNLPESCSGQVTETYLCEQIESHDSDQELASITEHGRDDLGIVAITVQKANSLLNYYPLTPGGLNDIHEDIQGMELTGGGMAFPGRVRFSASKRRLRPAGFDA